MSLKRLTAFAFLEVKDLLDPTRPLSDEAVDPHIHTAMSWLKRAQEANSDGGVSAYYSIMNGWAPSFVETTGYILGTVIRYSQEFPEEKWNKVIEHMGEFLLKMQLPSGAFQAYTRGKLAKKPIIFNTGQDLLGLCDMFERTHSRKYRSALVKTATYLTSAQNKDGSWTEINYDDKVHSYHSRIAYGLVKAYWITNDKRFLHAAKKNLDWTCSLQHENGWFDHAELSTFSSSDPVTHTLAYTTEGLLFSGLLLKNKRYIDTALKTISKLARIYQKDGQIWATYNDAWESTSCYVCLTGSAQIAQLWWIGYFLTRQTRYKLAAKKMNRFLMARQPLHPFDPNISGGMAGSFPIMGDIARRQGYCRLAFPNWATKFYVDTLLQERASRTKSDHRKRLMGKYVYS